MAGTGSEAGSWELNLPEPFFQQVVGICAAPCRVWTHKRCPYPPPRAPPLSRAGGNKGGKRENELEAEWLLITVAVLSQSPERGTERHSSR